MKLRNIIFGLLVLLLPTQLGKHFWPDFTLLYGLRIDYLSPTFYLIDLFVLFLLLLGLTSKRLNLKVSAWVFLFFLGLLGRTFFAANFGAGIFKLIRLVELFLLVLYVSQNLKAPRLLVKYLPWAVVYSSFLGIAQFLRQSSLGGVFWFLGERPLSLTMSGIALESLGNSLYLRAYASFSHPNSLAGFLLVSLILTLVSLRKSRYFLVYLGLSLGALILTFSYSAWLVGLLVVFLAGILKKEPKVILLGLFGLGVIVFSGFFLVDSLSVAERRQLLISSFLMIKQNFLWGVGLNNFLNNLPVYWLPVSFRLWQPVHNVYLLVLAEVGVVFFLGILLFLYKTLKKVMVEKKKVVVFLALMAILILGLFDHYWWTLLQNQVLFSLVLGLAWSKNLPKELQ